MIERKKMSTLKLVMKIPNISRVTVSLAQSSAKGGESVPVLKLVWYILCEKSKNSPSHAMEYLPLPLSWVVCSFQGTSLTQLLSAPAPLFRTLFSGKDWGGPADHAGLFPICLWTRGVMLSLSVDEGEDLSLSESSLRCRASGLCVSPSGLFI